MKKFEQYTQKKKWQQRNELKQVTLITGGEELEKSAIKR